MAKAVNPEEHRPEAHAFDRYNRGVYASWRLDRNRDIGRPKSGSSGASDTQWCGEKERDRVGKAKGRNY
jgi:hypothetical protein